MITVQPHIDVSKLSTGLLTSSCRHGQRLRIKSAAFACLATRTPLTVTPRRITIMASTRDVSHLTDIGKMKTESDGTFKRQDAEFRNFIVKGGKFEPESGKLRFLQP